MSEYVALAHFLKEALGQRYEITLRDVQEPDRSWRVEDHSIEGRPVSNAVQEGLIRDVLGSETLQKQNFLCTTGENGNSRESLFYIRDEAGVIRHMLCISEKCPRNVMVQEVVEDILRPRDSEKTNVSQEVEGMIRKQIEKVWEKHSRDGAKLTKAEKLAVIDELLGMGLFSLKGTPELVSHVTGFSLASVYRYLTEVIEE